MSWFSNLFKSSSATEVTDSQKDNLPPILKKLQIKNTVSITASCEAELKSFREFTYSPLPQRIFSIGSLSIAQQTVNRYYLWDDETWLQVSYDKNAPEKSIEIILFYWLRSKTLTPSELTDEVRLPLSKQQWEHQGKVFERCWNPVIKNDIPTVEHVVNKDESYSVHFEQMIFSRKLTPARKEYWFYSLEKSETDNTYLQMIAQGFSLDLAELSVN